MERLKDLLTILYRPRETMRRILDRGGDRWAAQVVFLAFVCASTNELDAQRLGEVIPGVKVLPVIAIIALVIVVGATSWVVTLFILSWIARPIGKMMGGVGTVSDVRAALGWAMVPVIWSPIYRIPITVVVSRAEVGTNVNVRQLLLDFLSHGGLSLVVLFLGFQFLFALWCLILGSFTVAEAHRFSTQKGFITVVITIALPLMIIAAAMFSTRGFTARPSP